MRLLLAAVVAACLATRGRAQNSSQCNPTGPRVFCGWVLQSRPACETGSAIAGQGGPARPVHQFDHLPLTHILALAAAQMPGSCVALPASMPRHCTDGLMPPCWRSAAQFGTGALAP